MRIKNVVIPHTSHDRQDHVTGRKSYAVNDLITVQLLTAHSLPIPIPPPTAPGLPSRHALTNDTVGTVPIRAANMAASHVPRDVTSLTPAPAISDGQITPF